MPNRLTRSDATTLKDYERLDDLDVRERLEPDLESPKGRTDPLSDLEPLDAGLESPEPGLESNRGLKSVLEDALDDEPLLP